MMLVQGDDGITMLVVFDVAVKDGVSVMFDNSDYT